MEGVLPNHLWSANQMNTKPYYAVCEMLSWPSSHKPKFKFKICETNFTIDGPRTRFVDGAWATKEEAEEYLKSKLES
jgi:hypothetical protein